MMHRAWSSIVEVPYCFSRSYVKFQGHTALKIVEFDPNWAFPDCNSSLNSPMAMKCCTKLEKAKERWLIVFQGHPLNFKITRYKTSPILTQIGYFRTIGRSQLSNPSDLPCSYHQWLHANDLNMWWQSTLCNSLFWEITRYQDHNLTVCTKKHTSMQCRWKTLMGFPFKFFNSFIRHLGHQKYPTCPRFCAYTLYVSYIHSHSRCQRDKLLVKVLIYFLVWRLSIVELLNEIWNKSTTLEFQISAYRRVFILIFLPAYAHLIWVYALN